VSAADGSAWLLKGEGFKKGGGWSFNEYGTNIVDGYVRLIYQDKYFHKKIGFYFEFQERIS